MPYIRWVYILIAIYFSDTYSSSFSSSRLRCLQHQLGKEHKSTLWLRGAVDNSTYEEMGWIYQSTICPLSYFDSVAFCQKSIGCGKKLLLVGDSTLYQWVVSVKNLMNVTITLQKCPDFTPCTKVHDECVAWWRQVSIEHLRTCFAHCPYHQPVQITYVRHDFLSGRHGRRFYRDSVCEYWWDILPSFDYVVISFGPHVSALLEHPYMRPFPANTSRRRVLHDTAAEVARRFMESNITRWRKQVPSAGEGAGGRAAHKPVVIFRTGPAGLEGYSGNCSERPHDAPPREVSDIYDWDMIPLANHLYITALQKVLKKQLLVMDTFTLLSKIHGCRADFLHFKWENITSPVLIEWMILHNILGEYHLSAESGAPSESSVYMENTTLDVILGHFGMNVGGSPLVLACLVLAAGVGAAWAWIKATGRMDVNRG